MLNALLHPDPRSSRSDVESFAQIHAGRPSVPFVSNLTTRVDVLGSGGSCVPVTVNHGEPDNAWVCSPYTAYCAYAVEEVKRLTPPFVSYPVATLCRAAGASLRRADIDRVVTINNWLLSTNLYGALDRDTLSQWIDEARSRWPDHAIWFRSLNDAWTPEWIAALRKEGAILLPSRQVYLYAEIARRARTQPNLKVDLKLLARTELQRCENAEIRIADYPRIEQLYSMLYLQKYSKLNPAYRASFVEAWHRAGLLNLTGFRNGAGVLEAVVGTFERAGVVTAPLVGYDTRLTQTLGLYRLLMAAVLKYAADSGQRVNLSAGAAHFKRTRGGVASIEYSAVLVDHLPAPRRRALHGLRWLTTHIGVPLMTRLKL
jgi:hypothetical protein